MQWRSSRARVNRAVFGVTQLESRTLFAAVPVTQYHNDLVSSGVNSAETVLSYDTVPNLTKLYSTPVDGQVYAQPLYLPRFRVRDSVTGKSAARNISFVATEHDSLYAIDTDSGNVVWKTSFQSVENTNNATGKVTVLNPLGATSIEPMSSDDTGSGDLTPEIGITATPVIDRASGTLFLVAKSHQTIGGDADHYVQTLYMVRLSDGSVLSSRVIADTRDVGGDYVYNTNGPAGSTPWVLGTGDGSIDVNGQSRVYFNAKRQFGRVGLTLYKGTVYMGFASHGDNGPYHGWMLAYEAGSLRIRGALNTTPNGGLGGIWQGGGSIPIDSKGFFYFETGNGSFNTSADNFATGYKGPPKDANYGDCFVKVGLDPKSSPSKQNPNGWGLKVVDYFSPFNNESLNNADADLGSGGLTILPDSVGSKANPRLLIGAGKEGKIYLLNRDRLGGFDPDTDHVVQEQGSALSGQLNTPGFFMTSKNAGTVVIVMGYGGGARAFSVANGAFSTTPVSSSDTDFGYLPGSPSISSSGKSNTVVWAINRNNSTLYALKAGDLSQELYNSSNAPNNRDRLGSAVKFSVPTVTDGRVLCGTGDSLAVYGLPSPRIAAPAAPSSPAATPLYFDQIKVTWTDNANNEDSFQIQRTTTPGNADSWTVIGTTETNQTTYTDTSVQANSTYYYRVRAFNSFRSGTYSAFTPAVSATTPDAPLTGSGDGLAVSYFDDNLSSGNHLEGSPVVTRVDPLISADDIWTSGDPDGDATALGTTNFSARWTGKVQAQYSELYTFTTTADDGVRLYINNQLLIDNFVDQAPTSRSATLTLSASQKYDLKLEYYQAGGGAALTLQWSSAHTPLQVIPTSQLYSGTAPAAPSNLTAVAAASVHVNLDWTDNSNIETGYVVERRAGTSGDFSVIATLAPNTTHYADAELIPSTTYQYRVKATNFASDSAYSPLATLTTPIPPAKPTNARTTAVSTTSISLAWDDQADNEDGYRISRAAGSGSFIVIAQLPANTTSYVDNNRTPGTEYEYHIQAYNVAGYNDFTGVRTATLATAPGNLAAQGTLDSVSLTWLPPATNLSVTTLKYNLYRSTTLDFLSPQLVASNLTAAAFNDTPATGLVEGLFNYYRVTALTAGGESASSNVVYVGTPIP